MAWTETARAKYRRLSQRVENDPPPARLPLASIPGRVETGVGLACQPKRMRSVRLSSHGSGVSVSA